MLNGQRQKICNLQPNLFSIKLEVNELFICRMMTQNCIATPQYQKAATIAIMFLYGMQHNNKWNVT